MDESLETVVEGIGHNRQTRCSEPGCYAQPLKRSYQRSGRRYW